MCTLCNVERVRMCEASVLNNNDGNNDDDKANLRTEDTEMEITMRTVEGKLQVQLQHKLIKYCC